MREKAANSVSPWKTRHPLKVVGGSKTPGLRSRLGKPEARSHLANVSPVRGISFAILLAFLLTSCATPPAGYRPLLRPMSVFPASSEAAKMDTPPAPLTTCFIWQYPTGAVVTAWILQSSSNLVDWVDIGPCPDCADPALQMSNACGFFRMKGTP